MKYFLLICALALLGVVSVVGQSAPKTIVLDGSALAKNKAAIKPSDPSLEVLVKRADKIVATAKLYSVMDKTQVPPSGDKHDYMSQAPYWWPDPSKKDGLPYIKRDGEVNPELKKISDTTEMDDLIDDSETTALAYYFTGIESYARHSASLIRTWFLDPKTRQNPNLNFSQAVPGINKGRGIGLIESRELYRVIDAAILLQTSKSWSPADHAALKKWFADFAKWMLESEPGRDEFASKNNHGTFYDVQVIAYSIFSENPEAALKQIEVSKRRIGSELEKDGSQPLELARTRSWNYTNMNLIGLLTLARLADNVKFDLWNYETDGRSIKKAVAWLAPFAAGKTKWTHQQITPVSYATTKEIFRLASQKYHNQEYAALADGLQANEYITAVDRLTN